MDKKREDRLKKICQAINSGDWGGEKKDAMTYLGSSDYKELERWTSGCPSLDDAMGGGWPRGRIIELYGPESGGKSTLCYHAIGEFQRKYPDEIVAIIDTEYTFDTEYAEKMGVNTDELMFHQPEHAEQALNVMRQLVENGVGLIVVDSVAALVPKAELEGDIGDLNVGLQARIMSQTCRIISTEAGRRNATVIFTNQVRDKIGVMYGDKTTTPGGRALRFYASLRVEIARIGSEKEGDVIVSNKVKATVKKSKVGVPYRQAQFIITFGKGIDMSAGLFDAAITKGIITKNGRKFFFGDDELGLGRLAALDKLRNSQDMQQKIKTLIGDYKPDEVKVVAPDAEDTDEKEESGEASEVAVTDA